MMGLFHKCCVFGVFFASLNAVILAQTGPVVTTHSGDVLGTYMTSSKGREFSAFRGIPFAQPPIGNLRFAAPVKADPWTDVFNATEGGASCYQLIGLGEEDCLNLNVYSPKLPSANDTTLLPVMVFIYGGAFILGSDAFIGYGPHRHMDYDMVLVLPNYRLGPFGFLSTYDAAATGNFGLLDQRLALEWVRDNIAAFGGDPNDVTLSGESAGSDSVTLQMMSPGSAGLFKRVIAESGTPLNPWSMVDTPRLYAEKLANKFNCSTNDSYEIVDCLRQQTPEEIYNRGIQVTVEELTLTFVPSLENPNESPLFLWEDPLTLLQEGRFNKVPLIAGFNRDEGCLLYSVLEPLGMFREINDFFFNVNVPLFLRIFTDFRENLDNVSSAIKELYYDPIDLNNTDLVTRTNIDLLSDMFMIPWVLEYNNLVSNNGVPVYTYEFIYVGEHSLTNFTGEPDVTHGGEMMFLFNMTFGLDRLDLNAQDSAFSDQFLELWTNFVIQGNPTPTGSSVIWDTTPFKSTLHLSINESLSMVPEYQTEKMNFWLVEVPKIVAGTA